MRREPRKQLRNPRETTACRHASTSVLDDQRLAPDRAVRREVLGIENDAVDLEQRLGDRASVDTRRSLVRKCLEGLYEAGLFEELALTKRAPVPGEDLRAALEREQLAQHLEGALVHLGQGNSAPRQLERWIAESAPREPSEPLGELSQRRRKTGHGARRVLRSRTRRARRRMRWGARRAQPRPTARQRTRRGS